MRTTRREFVDSNIWVYAHDAREPEKQRKAREFLSELETNATIVISTQVLLEFYSIATRKLGMPALEARSAASKIGSLDVVGASLELVQEAMDITVLHQLSVWDAMILAAAKARRCPVLWSEDLAEGTVLMGVKVKNPFSL